MKWTLEPDGKPQRWKVVNVHCEDRSGEILELEGFWTGGSWRIIGYKPGRRDLLVTEWASWAERVE